MLTVTLNGEPRQFDQALPVEELIERLGLAGKRIAVERNGEIVKRARYAETALSDGDRLEIVRMVGGG